MKQKSKRIKKRKHNNNDLYIQFWIDRTIIHDLEQSIDLFLFKTTKAFNRTLQKVLS